MGDIYELTLTLDLRDELSTEELAELRWHLGLGPRPGTLRVVTDFPFVVEDERGEPVVEDHPEPLLGRRGEAHTVGGALHASLVRGPGTGRGAWALTSRQEIHPDDFERVGALFRWLAGKAGTAHRSPDGGVGLGWTRFHEETRREPLVVRAGTVVWPS